MASAEVLALLLCASGLMAGERIVAQGGPYCLGDGGRDVLHGPKPRSKAVLEFTLQGKETVVVEAEGLMHLDMGPNAAPEVLLDDTFLGSLQEQQGRSWRALRRVELEPGLHRVLVRNAEVADADDFTMERLKVIGTSPEEAGTAAPAKGRRAALAREHRPCGDPARIAWPARLKGRSLTLSVLSGRETSSGQLAVLRSGEAWTCEARLPAPEGEPAAAGLRLETPGEGRVALVFALMPEAALDREALGYTPGAWETLTIRFCDGRLSVKFARAPLLEAPVGGKGLEFEVIARSVELSLKPTIERKKPLPLKPLGDEPVLKEKAP